MPNTVKKHKAQLHSDLDPKDLINTVIALFSIFPGRNVKRG